jgi:hypothetical protein
MDRGEKTKEGTGEGEGRGRRGDERRESGERHGRSKSFVQSEGGSR